MPLIIRCFGEGEASSQSLASRCKCSAHVEFLRFCYHATGDAVTGVSSGIGFHVVGLGMDNQCRSPIAENGVAVLFPIHISVGYLRFRLAVSAHGEVLHVAGMMAFWILKPVLLAVRIEMGAGRFEIRGITPCILVDVDGMLSRRQIMQVELDHHTIALIHQR